MVVSVVLQLVYVLKFYLWETGYFCSLDMQHDRAGYHILWGCLVWVPCMYTSTAFYLVRHPIDLGWSLSLGILVTGLMMIWINYDCDRQRQTFRKNTKQKIWGKPPVKIDAQYTTADGEVRSNVLLASGCWGMARHFHYVPEILASLCWSLPALFENFLPYFYVLFLSILLVDRASSIDARCASKYKQYWVRYCALVSY